MTYIGSPIFGSAFYVGPTSTEEPVDPDEPAKPVDPVDRPQVVTAHAALPGFGKAPPPSPAVYWAMRRYSACVLAYAVTAGPIFAGSRAAVIRNADGTEATPPGARTGVGVQVTASPEDKRRKLVDDVFEDQWPDILNGLECLNFGQWLQETIWERTMGVTAPVRFKSFLPWDVQLLRDRYNDFAGYKHQSEERDARYAFHAVCQPHFDPLFGVPRAENAREDWWRAVESANNADKTENKASGRQMMLELPTGSTFTDASGNPVLTQAMVQTIVNAAASGQTFTIPIPWKKDDIKANPKLAEVPLVRVKDFDWGQTGPALLAHIARMDSLEKKIFRAWHRPEREAMEGSHGTKAEAGVHGQVGIIDSEKVHGDFIRQFNRQVVDRFLVTNFPDAKPGSIYFKPAPLADPQQAFKQEVAKALLGSPTAGPTMQANVDGRRLLKETELPLVPEGSVVQPVPMDPPEPDDEDGEDNEIDDDVPVTDDARLPQS